MPELFAKLAEWRLTRGYLSTVIRGEGGDFMAVGSENVLITGAGLTRAFRGPLLLAGIAGSRVFFNCDTSFAGLGDNAATGQIESSVLRAGGTGYAVNDTGLINTGNGLAAYKVLTVAAGVVLTYSITAKGATYSDATGVTTATGGAQPGAGTGFTLDILTVSGRGKGSVYKVQDLLCYIGEGQVAFDGALLSGIYASATLTVLKKAAGVYASGANTGPFAAGEVQPPAAVIYAMSPSAGQKSMNGAVSVVIWRINSKTGQISLMSAPSNVLTLVNQSVVVQMPLKDNNGQDFWGVGVVKIGFADLGWFYELPTSLNGEIAESALSTVSGHTRSFEISWTNGSLLGQDTAPDKAFPPALAEFSGTMNDVAWLDAAGIIYVSEPNFIGSYAPSNALFASEPAVCYLKVNDTVTARLGKTTIGTLYYVGGSPALEYQVIVENQGIAFAQNAFVGANGRLCAFLGVPTVIDQSIDPDFNYARDVIGEFAGWTSQTADNPVCGGFDGLGRYECWIWQRKIMAKFVPDDTWCSPIILTVGVGANQVIGNVVAAVTVHHKLYLCCSDGTTLAVYQFDAGTGSIMKVQTSDVSLMSYFCNLSLIMVEGRVDNLDNPITVEAVINYDDSSPVSDPLGAIAATPVGVGSQVFAPRQPNILNVNQHAIKVTMDCHGGDAGVNRIQTMGPRWEVLSNQTPTNILPQIIDFGPLDDVFIDLGTQTITFAALPDLCVNPPPADFVVSATSDSGLIVQFAITGPATLVDHGDGTATVTMTGGFGEVSITASQPGNGLYSPAPDVIRSFEALDCAPG